MRHWIFLSIFAGCAAPVGAQDAGAAFLEGVATLSVSDCHALADSIPDLDNTGTSAEALDLLGRAVREQCFLTAMLAETAPTGVTRGRAPDESNAAVDLQARESAKALPVLTDDMKARARASENLLKSAMAADSGVQNDLLRRLLGQDPVPKG